MSVAKNLESALYTKHKELFTRVVMPVILITTTFLILSHWRNDKLFYAGLAVCLGLDVFNVYFSIKNREIYTPFGTIDSRSDEFDTFRWVFNLIGDTFLVFALQLEIASAMFIWLILTFGAFAEVYHRRNRVLTVSIATVCFIFILAMYGTKWQTGVYALSCYLGLVFIMFKFERNLVTTLTDFFAEAHAREQLENEQEILRREAVLGVQAMSICHEINNVLTIIYGTSNVLRNGQSLEPGRYSITVERLNRAVDTISQISRVVLNDIGTRNIDEREYTVAEIFRDFELLLISHFRSSSLVKFEMNLSQASSIAAAKFKERSGTTYLIVHNLVKNAMNASEVQSKRNRIMNVSLFANIDQQSLRITVRDGAGGIPETIKQRIDAGKRVRDSKSDGHGLGLLFVFTQAKKSGMDLKSEPNEVGGTDFILTIPLFPYNSESLLTS